MRQLLQSGKHPYQSEHCRKLNKTAGLLHAQYKNVEEDKLVSFVVNLVKDQVTQQAYRNKMDELYTFKKILNL